ncbi:MAG: extracellular solute-binding protein [Firmicutes bacterium]|nr:extracellular solute-binding protein [Bacillota bacterium]
MKRSKLQRIVALLLTVVMLMGTLTITTSVSADDEDTTDETEETDDGTDDSTTTSTSSHTSLQELSDTLNAESYAEYQEDYDYSTDKRATQSVTILAAEAVVEDETDAETEVYTDYNGVSGDSLYIGDTGTVTWTVNIPETGFYAMKIIYYPIDNKDNSIERMLYINGAVPFSEARYLAMTRIYVNEYSVDEDGNYVFDTDINGNDIRPSSTTSPKWCTYTLMDSNGYYADALELYFEEGENTIALEAVREPVVIYSITLYPYEDLPTYDEVEAEYAANGYTEATSSVRIDAEFTTATSHITIYPIYDRTSAITDPQDPVLIKLNTIGDEHWETAGQWIEYEIEVPEDGLYTIAMRFKQSELSGLFTSRRLYIDGEIPFEECNYLRFEYSNNWQSKALGVNAEGDEPYQFYLTAGTHTLRFEVTLGELGSIVRQVSETLDVINDCYLSILKLTGASPDSYRDYGFSRTIPDTLVNLVKEGRNLQDVIDRLETLNGGASENTATLSEIQRLVEKMGSDEDEIASNLSLLKTYIGSLGTWINTVVSQPLEIDYIMVQPASAELPQAEAGFFEAVWFEIRSFVGSFYTDYNSLGSTVEVDESNSVEVWVVTGRDQANIIRTLIDNTFTPYSNISVNLKLVAGGTLLPSILAGVGPDVSLFTGDGDVINYAIRGALQGMNDKLCKSCAEHGVETLKYVDGGDTTCDVCGASGEDNWELYFDTFDEVTARFSESATVPLTLYGETFAIPETQTFPMLFYRKDVLVDLGLEVPETWDDLLSLIPVLQYNNMDVGLTSDYLTYLYQMGGELYADNGTRVNLDSNLALEAFEMMCNMFTMYSLPYSYDFANRFRTGEMPVAVAAYTSYNQLTVFATEISGLWEFTTIPGMLQEDGSVNYTAVSTVVGVVMIKGSENKENAWAFIDWYTDTDFQSSYSNELVALLGSAGMNPTANIEALETLSWTKSEYAALYDQFSHLTAVPNYPGSYIISRYTNFAFLSAYNDGASPSNSLLGYVNTINKEFTRKREEFGLETLEVGQTLAEKRVDQALEVIDDLSSNDKTTYQILIDEFETACDNALSGNATQEDYDALLTAAENLKEASSLFDDVYTYASEAVTALESYV